MLINYVRFATGVVQKNSRVIQMENVLTKSNCVTTKQTALIPRMKIVNIVKTLTSVLRMNLLVKFIVNAFQYLKSEMERRTVWTAKMKNKPTTLSWLHC